MSNVKLLNVWLKIDMLINWRNSLDSFHHCVYRWWTEKCGHCCLRRSGGGANTKKMKMTLASWRHRLVDLGRIYRGRFAGRRIMEAKETQEPHTGWNDRFISVSPSSCWRHCVICLGKDIPIRSIVLRPNVYSDGNKSKRPFIERKKGYRLVYL